MQLVDVMRKVPKESKELIDFAVKLMKLALKKEWAKILELVGDAVKAAEGASEVPAEIASEHKPALAGYVVQEVYEAL